MVRKHINKLRKVANYELVKPRIARLLDQHSVAKLNIGCGTDYKIGWINIDNNSDDNIEKLDLNWDLRNPLPFSENSVDFIFNEHFIEHLTVEESRMAISDMMRVLKPGGVMRIAMPDLADVIDSYSNVPLEKNHVIRDHGLDFIKTPAEYVNISFRWWGHMWLYDWVELTRRLEELGFNDVIRCKHGKSSHKELQGLESRNGSILIAEVKKPL